MKKFFAIALIAASFVACNEGEKTADSLNEAAKAALDTAKAAIDTAKAAIDTTKK
jgi:hypothetical protein